MQKWNHFLSAEGLVSIEGRWETSNFVEENALHEEDGGEDHELSAVLILVDNEVQLRGPRRDEDGVDVVQFLAGQLVFVLADEPEETSPRSLCEDVADVAQSRA